MRNGYLFQFRSRRPKMGNNRYAGLLSVVVQSTRWVCSSQGRYIIRIEIRWERFASICNVVDFHKINSVTIANT